MKAPKSYLTRQILADPQASEKLVDAVRGQGTEIKANGHRYTVPDAPNYVPDTSSETKRS